MLDCKRQVDVEKIERGIFDAKMFISAVVFSVMQPDGCKKTVVTCLKIGWENRMGK